MDPSPNRLTHLKHLISIIAGIGAAIIYGGITRLLFEDRSDILGSLSVSFFCITPFALGFLTVSLAPKEQQHSWLYTILAPWISCSICILLAGLFALEAWFCIIIAFPFFLCIASLGGLAARLARWIAIKIATRHLTTNLLILLLAAPHILAPIEHLLPIQDDMRQVHSQRRIHAPPAIVWQHITNLREIQPTEQPWALFHLVGLPRPRAAHMACEHTGCTRTGTWEHGLAFEGTITKIVPLQTYWVQLHADTRAIEPSMAPLSQIGGPVFDMIDDGYVLEDLGQGETLLTLYSTYRVSSRLNYFAYPWLDTLLRDIQHFILSVEQARAEQQAAPSPPHQER